MRPAILSLLFAVMAVGGAPMARAEGGDHKPVQLPHTELRSLASKIVGVDYILYVSLPRDYAANRRDYPVVYTLDADYSFALAHNIVEHFVDRGDLPPMIIIGIGYRGASQNQRTYRINRARDYTPTPSLIGAYGKEINAFTGGGGKFRRFLVEELIPFVEANYRASDDRTIVGHSWGGLFGTYVLFTRPETFRRYILISPSLWWDFNSGLDYEADYAKSHRSLPAKVFYGIGGLENTIRRPMVDTMNQLLRNVEQRSYRGLRIKSHVFDEETHNSVFPAALTRGLRFVFDD